MVLKLHTKTAWAWIFLLAGCLEPYQPPDVNTNLNALVVDGFVNISAASVTVRLSRTASLSNKQQSIPEKKAVVTLEEAGNSAIVVVPENESGLYTRFGLTLNPQSKYRLHVRTTQAKNYFSDFVEFKKTPPIDSVFWEGEREKGGIQIYVATHDPANSTRYYQWNYVETYQHTAYYESHFIIQDGAVARRPKGTEIYTCWTTENSTSISIATSKNLSQDVIRHPLLFIPKESLKLSAIYGKYSILVQQNTLDETAYTFWQQLQKTTENLGGLFDPLPSQVFGNVDGSGTSASEVVLGHFGGGTVTEKRIFIEQFQLPDYVMTTNFGPCPLIDLIGPGSPPLSLLPNGFPILNEMAQTSPGACIDCRVDGGTTTKPSFWP